MPKYKAVIVNMKIYALYTYSTTYKQSKKLNLSVLKSQHITFVKGICKNNNLSI